MAYMNTITSTEFRKTYQQLKEATIVSVLGYAIGIWMPAPSLDDPEAVEEFKALQPRSDPLRLTPPIGGPSFNTRPFTPAPKGK